MLSKLVNSPHEYLAYSQQELSKQDALNRYPKLTKYYENLCTQFHQIYEDDYPNLFQKLGNLLSVDAQIQLLLDLILNATSDLCQEIGLTEEEIISMIQHDKNYFYRELTGISMDQEPRWSLIYLSED